MSGNGRVNSNPSTSSILEDRRLHREFYSSIHKTRVTDLHLEKGTVTVKFVDGGDAREVPIPLVGYSLPPKNSDTDKNYLRASWGVYFPQVGDILLVGFNPSGGAYALGYHTLNFENLNLLDSATEETGGIGWGDASGKRLRPGDWSFKSARGCAFYMGDRTSLTAGSHSIVLDKPQSEVRIQSELVHHRYGDSSESRLGATRRILVPGVDTTASYVYDPITASVAQEHTHYVRRNSLTAPTPDGLVMVRTSEGQVIDDTTLQVAPPSVFAPELATALKGTGVRVLRRTYDDASGMIPLWTELVDNLGNWGMSSTTALGFQWFTPASTWTVLNNIVSWNTVSKYDLGVGLDYSITVGGKMSVKVGGLFELGASLIRLGLGASEPLIKGTAFATAMSSYLTTSASTFTALATACGAPPLTPLATSFTALATAAGALSASLNGMLSTMTMTL